MRGVLGFLRPPRWAETDNFLACAAKTKQRLAAARTRPCTPSLSSTIVVFNRMLREMLRYSDRKKTMTMRNTCFPDRTYFVYSFHQIESNSIRFIKIESFRFKSVLRAFTRNERNMNRCYYYTYAVRCSVCLTDETYVLMTS